jgi:hypothetical protein
MELAKLRYEGCTVEATVKSSDQKVGLLTPTVIVRIFDPKGKEIVNDVGELGGYSVLEDRLISRLPEPIRSELRKAIRWEDAYLCHGEHYDYERFAKKVESLTTLFKEFPTSETQKVSLHMKAA